jgi:hypothetical protein
MTLPRFLVITHRVYLIDVAGGCWRYRAGYGVLPAPARTACPAAARLGIAATGVCVRRDPCSPQDDERGRCPAAFLSQVGSARSSGISPTSTMNSFRSVGNTVTVTRIGAPV